ncbi:hypothetical protein EU95_0931 [Prochlorococcus marinus str. MIT 9201]|uniref:Uncharacterized protein n=1 Tax=Prochlorococcus marinus str. MIT 9201 TaxID=93057 RepID=A0A0A2A5P6_PROMR|nr:hypothetical protein EU95_0931 [Prochlorococcus marinus str. MIT 9201]
MYKKLILKIYYESIDQFLLHFSRIKFMKNHLFNCFKTLKR